MMLKNQISDKDIERSLWLINNKKKIMKIIIIILIVLCVLLYTISAFEFIKFFTTKDVTTNDFVFINFQNKQRANDLIISNKQIITRDDGKYDIVATLYNPNESFVAREIKYQFVINNIPREEKTTFIMPKETKKIYELGIDSDTRIDSFDVFPTNISWKKIKQNEITEYLKPKFEITEEKLNINPENQSIRNWINFQSKNISIYNFKNVKFSVFLYVGSQIVAIGEIEQTNFKSQEQRKLQTSWYYLLPSYATAEIQAETNLLDENNYFLEN